VFVGDLLTRIIERIAEGGAGEDAAELVVDMGVGKLPQLAQDYTDRNRTSPFAFTGNKFEFRAVGSSMNCAGPMAVLLGAVADSIGRLGERLRQKLGAGGDRDQAVLELLREVFKETSPVRFGGNNYSDEWKAEAARRGLPNLADTPAALEMLRDPKRTGFLREQSVFTELELASRYNIAIERYIKHVTLEAETLLEMLRTMVIPAGEKQLAGTLEVWGGLNAAAGAKLADAARGATEAGAGALTSRVAELSAVLAGVMGVAGELEALLDELDGVHDEAKAARRLADEVRPLMDRARVSADRLEHLVDDELWELPKYREMLFVR